MNENEFQMRAVTLLERGVDVTRASDGLAASRLLLVLVALRRVSDRVPGTGEAWERARDGAVLMDAGATRATLRDVADLVEAAHPDLRGIFTEALSATTGASDALLPTWVRELWDMGPVVGGGPPGAFARWFDTAIDTMAMRMAGRGQPSITPRPLADLMVRLARVDPLRGAYDACCGYGGILAAVSRSVPAVSRLSGQDLDGDTVRLARLRLSLLTGRAPRIEAGDTLRRPMHVSDREVERFGSVLCHPPVGQRLSDLSFIDQDRLGRFPFGRVGRTGSEFAFVQHALASLENDGKGVFLLPPGPFFRGGADALVRAGLVRDDLVASVVGLPVGLLPGLSIEVLILVVDRGKKNPGEVMFVDASDRRDAARDKEAWEELASDIVKVCSPGGGAENGFSVAVPTDKILDAGCSLHPRDHLPRGRTRRIDGVDPWTRLLEASELEATAREVAIEMDELAAEFDSRGRSSDRGDA